MKQITYILLLVFSTFTALAQQPNKSINEVIKTPPQPARLVNDFTTKAPVLLAYPNPAASDLNIDLSNWQGPVTIMIFDLTGKVFYLEIVSAAIFKYDVQHLASGVYILRATDPSGESQSVKWVKD